MDTGESNPRTFFEYMNALVDRYGKYDDQVKFRIAHFHECRGQSLANTFSAVLAGARIIETSLGMGGGQPAFMVDGIPGKGSGPIYTNSWEVGNCPTEDSLVMLDEMGIQTAIDIDLMLCLGRVFEWTMGRTLPVWTTKAGTSHQVSRRMVHSGQQPGAHSSIRTAADFLGLPGKIHSGFTGVHRARIFGPQLQVGQM